MIPLFTKESLIILQSLSFTKALYAFDFDGTLAKIVKDPSAAEMSETTRGLLQKLSKLAPVAIISGRSIADLRGKIPFQTVYLIGNHGLEGLPGKNGSLAKCQQLCRAWLQSLQSVRFESGVEIEDKTYSLAIHYRKSRSKTRARSQIKSAQEKLDPLPNVIPGKCVVNLLPPGAPHKGAALLELLSVSDTKHAFYIGDDDTDEDIFGLRYNNGQIMTARIGKKRKSQAGYYVDRQSDINRVLKSLLHFHTLKNGDRGSTQL